jgi:hypothetical protein
MLVFDEPAQSVHFLQSWDRVRCFGLSEIYGLRLVSERCVVIGADRLREGAVWFVPKTVVCF